MREELDMKWIATAFVLMATSVVAETVPVPEGCEAYATVHKDSCVVTSYLKCGEQVDAVSYARGELEDTHSFGPTWDMIAYFADEGRMHVQAQEGTMPEASLSDAFETGVSTGERAMVMAGSMLAGEELDLQSKMSFGDETVEISGTTLRKGTLTRTMTIRKNGVTAQYDFEIFASEDQSLFIEGAANVDQFGRKSRLEWTPRKISYPGEAGFLATTSDIACE
ncbi:hypothetical protein BXY66_2929 [Shimia isoporae]|uniref:Uncharacterized protein n=1 Tax=Shimia isoporae TaxID=647720 RepID=A0A4R1N924_9RHOB|nr:hypothetical protein [Shimia isoporae]TCL01614.1 hypothetical protein BXY66_2929 [Shimia isoporae]